MTCSNEWFPNGSPGRIRRFKNGSRRVYAPRNDPYGDNWPGDIEYAYCYERNGHFRYKLDRDLNSFETNEVEIYRQ